MISILILTKNEEFNLPACLESVKWCDDIHVFDSRSTDRTQEIARSYEIQYAIREFDGYASQRNAALRQLNFKYDWIFILDADERIPLETRERLVNSVGNLDSKYAGIRLRRRDFLFNTWLKHAQISPYFIRLVRKGKAYYSREINEILQVNGEVLDLKDVYFDHFPFNKGIRHWIEKHNRYSDMEARQWLKEHNEELGFSMTKAFFSKDFSTRRFHQKGLFYKLPFRPLIKWCYMIFWRLSFLDGQAGITYATLQSIYEYFIVLKTKELIRLKREGKNPPF